MSDDQPVDPIFQLDPQGYQRPSEPMTRVSFNYGQLLGAEDFRTEQAYHVFAQRVHNALLHGYGTVRGLRVWVEDGEDGECLRVAPGLALDPLGRALYVSKGLCLRLAGIGDKVFEDLQDAPGELEGTVRKYAWIVARHVVCASGQVPAILPPCGQPSDSATNYSRVHDSVVIELSASAPELPQGLFPAPPSRPKPEDECLASGGDPRMPARMLTWRDALLRAVLVDQPGLGQLWSASVKCGVALARIVLRRNGGGAIHVETIDNSIRPLLPAVQWLAERFSGHTLAGQDTEEPRLRVRSIWSEIQSGIPSEVDDGVEGLQIHICLSEAPLAEQNLADSIRVQVFSGGAWTTPTPNPVPMLNDHRISITIAQQEVVPSHWRVHLAGEGDSPLMSASGPLAGWVEDSLPKPGRGRDIACIGTWGDWPNQNGG